MHGAFAPHRAPLARGEALDQAPREPIVRSDEERALERIARGRRITALEITARPVSVALGEPPLGDVLLAGPCGFEGGNRRGEVSARACLGGGGTFRRTLKVEPTIEKQNAWIVRFELKRMRKLGAAAGSRKRCTQSFEFRHEPEACPLQRERLSPVGARLQ